MSAKPGHGTKLVKKPLLQAPGVDDKPTGKSETRGILTVEFTPGEPILKIATPAIKFWKQFDETVSRHNFTKFSSVPCIRV